LRPLQAVVKINPRHTTFAECSSFSNDDMIRSLSRATLGKLGVPCSSYDGLRTFAALAAGVGDAERERVRQGLPGVQTFMYQ